MTVPVLSAGQWLAHRSGWMLSNLELQKILYLAHMFHLGRTGEPLVTGLFEAWDYGPVHPVLYQRVKVFGSDPVENVFHDVPEVPQGPEMDILEEAFVSLGDAGPGKLVNATHRKGGAWATHYSPGVRGRIIPNAAIRDEFQRFNDAE